jgi:hypothetical protein
MSRYVAEDTGKHELALDLEVLYPKYELRSYSDRNAPIKMLLSDIGNDPRSNAIGFFMEWKWNRKRRISGDSNPECLKYARYDQNVLTQLENDARAQDKVFEIYCNLSPSCSHLVFKSIPKYESHFAAAHQNVCSQCNRVLPTTHLLHLHLLEVHDSFFYVYSRTKDSYECFVDNCSVKSFNPTERNKHLISAHDYPNNFHFDVVLGESSVGKKRNSKASKKPASRPETVDIVTDKLFNLRLPKTNFGQKKSQIPSSYLHIKAAHQKNAPETYMAMDDVVVERDV